jgi:hypothetical protein
MTGIFFDIGRELRAVKRRDALEERTPLVIYNRGSSYGTTRLASIAGYLAMQGWPPDYSKARQIENPDDLRAIKEAQHAIYAARKAADKVYARAFKRGSEIDPAKADAAEKWVDR